MKAIRSLSRRPLPTALAALGLLGLIALIVLTSRTWDRGVTKEQALQAEPDLTLAQVEKLFGGPGKPVRFEDDPSRPGEVLIVLDSPSRNWVKAEIARDPAATWRVWRGAPSDGDDVYWIVYLRDGVLVERFGAGGPGFWKRWRSRLGLKSEPP